MPFVVRREPTPAGEPTPTRKPTLARAPHETTLGTSRASRRELFEPSELARPFEPSEPTRLPRVCRSTHPRVVARREQTPAGEPTPTRKPALARVPCETKRGTSRRELLEPS